MILPNNDNNWTFLFRSGSKIAGPSGARPRRSGVAVRLWRSTDSMGPWCDTRFPCRTPSSNRPRTTTRLLPGY